MMMKITQGHLRKLINETIDDRKSLPKSRDSDAEFNALYERAANSMLDLCLYHDQDPNLLGTNLIATVKRRLG